MSAFHHAYQSLSSTGQKVAKRPRLFIPVALATIALLGATYLWISEYDRLFRYGDILQPVSYGSYHLDGIPPTRDLHMTEEQCTTAFPPLYQEADRAREYYDKKGGIGKRDVDAAEEEGHARVVILNNTASLSVWAIFVSSSMDSRCSSRRFEEGSTPGRMRRLLLSIGRFCRLSNLCLM